MWASGTAEDDAVIEYLQTLGQPFAMYDFEEENEEERPLLGIEHADRPAFWAVGMTRQALVGLDAIKAQFEYEEDWRSRVPSSTEEWITFPRKSDFPTRSADR